MADGRGGRLYVFAKRPVMGAVKTRLARNIGACAATMFYRRTLRRTLIEAATPAPWTTILAVDPPGAVFDIGVWPARVPRIAQGPGSLGDRMGRVMGPGAAGAVVIIGTDCPQMRRHHIEAAFRALKTADMVFGPAEDGGYWLIGARRRRIAPHLFRHVRWSSKHTLADTVTSAPTDFRIAYLETLRDVDTGADYRAVGHFTSVSRRRTEAVEAAGA